MFPSVWFQYLFFFFLISLETLEKTLMFPDECIQNFRFKFFIYIDKFWYWADFRCIQNKIWYGAHFRLIQKRIWYLFDFRCVQNKFWYWSHFRFIFLDFGMAASRPYQNLKNKIENELNIKIYFEHNVWFYFKIKNNCSVPRVFPNF